MFSRNIFIFLKDAAFGLDHRCNCFQCVSLGLFHSTSGLDLGLYFSHCYCLFYFGGPESFSFSFATFHHIIIYLKLINRKCIHWHVQCKIVLVWMRGKTFRSSNFISNIYVLQCYILGQDSVSWSLNAIIPKNWKTFGMRRLLNPPFEIHYCKLIKSTAVHISILGFNENEPHLANA